VEKVQVVFVGGFLGGQDDAPVAGGRLLLQRGKRVGLITNDQAPDLVDTKWLVEKGLNVREVAGSCFCCNFAGLIYAAEKLLAAGVDVLIGEPVGSCTDLSATILQPLKDRFRGQFVLSPLSILADPSRLRDILAGPSDALHPDAAYIFRKQLEEADLLVVNKMDLLSSEERQQLEALVAARLPQVALRFLSAQTGSGVEPWLDEVLSSRLAGTRLLDVDYDLYASGEAVLGWLNADLRLSGRGPGRVGTACRACWPTSDAAATATPASAISAPAHRPGRPPRQPGARPGRCRGRINPPPQRPDLNARVECRPGTWSDGPRHPGPPRRPAYHIDLHHLECLRPGRPRPTYRYDEVVT
jgi:Ni2+-binding GTPase involved in maturation of urease and hydrogenase